MVIETVNSLSKRLKDIGLVEQKRKINESKIIPYNIWCWYNYISYDERIMCKLNENQILFALLHEEFHSRNIKKQLKKLFTSLDNKLIYYQEELDADEYAVKSLYKYDPEIESWSEFNNLLLTIRQDREVSGKDELLLMLWGFICFARGYYHPPIEKRILCARNIYDQLRRDHNETLKD